MKTARQRKWRRGTVEAKCEYCGDQFLQQMPWQKFCCNSHKTMANVAKHRDWPQS